jgi:hypothetical protein
MTRLIDELVDGLEPAPSRPAIAIFGPPLAVASLVPFALTVVVLGFRADMASAIVGIPFWVKLAAPALVAGAAGLALARLSRPGRGAGSGLMIAALTMLVLLAAGLASLIAVPEGLRLQALIGSSLVKCLISISSFAVPFLIAGFWALRRMAPVRPHLAGFALGLVAGGLSAAVYALSCGEDALAFIASWYQLGILIISAAAALIAPRILRW